MYMVYPTLCIQYTGLDITTKGSRRQPRARQEVAYADVNRAKAEECRSTEEHFTDSTAYGLMQSQATYADVLVAEQRKTS